MAETPSINPDKPTSTQIFFYIVITIITITGLALAICAILYYPVYNCPIQSTNNQICSNLSLLFNQQLLKPCKNNTDCSSSSLICTGGLCQVTIAASQNTGPTSSTTGQIVAAPVKPVLLDNQAQIMAIPSYLTNIYENLPKNIDKNDLIGSSYSTVGYTLEPVNISVKPALLWPFTLKK